MRERIKALVLIAVNECGHHVKNCLSVIENSKCGKLSQEELKSVKSFLTWAFFDWRIRDFNFKTIDARWKQWQKKNMDYRSATSTEPKPKTVQRPKVKKFNLIKVLKELEDGTLTLEETAEKIEGYYNERINGAISTTAGVLGIP